jgi:hypothetical protein
MNGSAFRLKVFNTLCILFVTSIVCIFIKDLFSEWSFSSYQISEFLINYEGGFVRRGLLGELLFWFAEYSGIDVVLTIKVISVVCCVSVCLFFVREFLKRGYSLYIIPLCFFCGGIILSMSWIRKDFLMFCCFISILLIYRKGSIPLLLKIILINLISVFMILTHEVFGFFTFPVVFFLLFYVFRKSMAVFTSGLIAFISLLPCLLAFLLVLHAHGSPEIAQAIWNSWSKFSVNELPSLSADNAIGALGWSSGNTFSYHFSINFLKEEYYLLSIWYWVLVCFSVYYISTNVLSVFKKNPEVYTVNDRKILTAILLFQFLCLLPLFTVLSIDYLRIFSYLTVSSFALFLIIPSKIFTDLVPAFGLRGIQQLNAWTDQLLPPSRTTVAFLMLTIGISYSGYALKTIWMSTMIYRIFLLLSEPILLLRDHFLKVF